MSARLMMMSKVEDTRPVLKVEVRSELESDCCKVCKFAAEFEFIEPCGECGWVFQEYSQA